MTSAKDQLPLGSSYTWESHGGSQMELEEKDAASLQFLSLFVLGRPGRPQSLPWPPSDAGPRETKWSTWDPNKAVTVSEKDARPR